MAEQYFPDTVNFNGRDITTLVRYIYNTQSKNKLNTYIETVCGRIDIAHLHIYYGKLTASILSVLKKKKIPVVQTLHEYKLVCPIYKLFDGHQVCYSCMKNHFFHCFFKKCNRKQFMRSLLSTIESYVSVFAGSQSKIDKFITVSHFQKYQIIKMGFPPKKLTTIHNYIDTKTYLRSDSCERYFVYFGRIEKIKGIKTLIDAMKIVTDNRPNARLKIAGIGEFLPEAQKYTKDLNLPNVDFLGFMNKSKLNDLVKKAIFNIVPSIWFETFGLTIGEAFAMGIPSIVSNIGGMPELINEGIDGFIVPPGNARALSWRMIDVYDNIRLSRQMGEAGRKKIMSQFSPEAHFKQLHKIYKEFL
jgi:glycosyltransferase involved in cell wall biosynthesis